MIHAHIHTTFVVHPHAHYMHYMLHAQSCRLSTQRALFKHSQLVKHTHLIMLALSCHTHVDMHKNPHTHANTFKERKREMHAYLSMFCIDIGHLK
jgi:hypothetical protein